MKKRLLSLFLAICMVLGTLPTAAFATENDASYTSITADLDGDVTVTDEGLISYDSIQYYHVVVPKGATYAYVTYPADTIYVYNNLAQVTVASMDFSSTTTLFPETTTNSDGSVTVKLKITDYLTEEAGTGTGLFFWGADTGSVLEGFTFAYAEDESVCLVTLPVGDGYAASGAGSVKTGENYTFTVTVKNGYDSTNMVVAANGKELTANEDGSYTVSAVAEDLTITVEGVVAIASDGSVTVYMTVSKDYDFVEANDGTVMSLVEMEVPYFDIGENYGLSAIYYNPDCYANGAYGEQVGGTTDTADGIVTMLHVIIWATEVYMCDVEPAVAGQGYLAENSWPNFSITTAPGSAFISFWDFGGNVNYYLNYEYPLGAPGWGATCDQIPVHDGDVLSFRYNAWSGNDGTYYHFEWPAPAAKTVTQGNDVTLTLYATAEDYTDYTTGHTAVGEGEYVYVIPAADMQTEYWDYSVADYETNSSGQVTISTSKLEAGTYYIVSETHDPAVMILEVEAGEHIHSYTAVVTEPTCTEGGYTTYTCECGDNYVADETDALGHSYEDGTCTRCGAELLYGDVKQDGEVNVKDANLISAYVNGKTELSAEQLAAADVDLDGEVTLDDATIISAYFNKYIDTLPHSHTYEAEVTTEATCTEAGETTYTCACTISYTEEIEALGHSYEDGTCTRCGAEDPDYVLASGQCGDELYWKLYGDGRLVITGSGDMEAFSNSTKSPWYSDYATVITSVELPDELTTIGNYAFYGCTGLTSIVIPDKVTAIGTSAFSGCTGLTSASIGSSVTSIGGWAFYQADLRNVVLPDSVTSIGSYSFGNNFNLESIDLNNVTSIDGYAFFKCSSLKEIVIPEGVMQLKGMTFQQCSSLESVTLPSTLIRIGSSEFRYCYALKSIEIPDSVTYISNNAFGYTGLTSIVIPDSVVTSTTYVLKAAFEYCEALESVTLGSGVTMLNTDMFLGCTALTSITIPETVTEIKATAFSGCTALTEVWFAGDAPTFGTNAFKSVTATAYYPANNATWTSTVMKNYGGNITWVAYEIPAASITLDSTSLTLGVDVSHTLTATLEPANTTTAVVWSSSDESVATVEDGVITTVATGTAVITATAGDVSATCSVTVADLTPTVTISTNSQYFYGNTPYLMTVKYTVGTAGELSYQWGMIDADGNDILFEDATANTYRPEGQDVGSYTYFCDVTNTVDGHGYTGRQTKVVKCLAADLPYPEYSGTSYEYTGETYGPTITVTTSDGEVLVEGVDYTLVGTASASDPGAYSITVTGIGNYANSTRYPRKYIVAWHITSEPAQVEGVYQISNAAELIWFVNKVNGGDTDIDALVTADIDMTAATDYTGIGTKDYPYTGTFDGGEHTITVNMYVEGTVATDNPAGILAVVSGATIKNIVMKGSLWAYNGAGIVGRVVSSDTVAVIENCVNYANVASSNKSYGGIVGQVNSKSIIRNCVNYGTCGVGSSYGYSQGTGAGIVGSITAAGTLVTNCANHGTFQTYTTTAGGMSGIVGSSSGGTESDPVVIEYCYNTADLKGASSVGGILGGIGSGSYTTVHSCYNTGSVTGTYINGGQRGIGGIVGNAAYGVVNISDVYNTGDVKCTSASSTASGMGGILGYSNKASTITNAYNAGTVSTSTTLPHGSILGYALNTDTKMVNCHWLEGTDTAMFSGTYVSSIDGIVDAESAETMRTAAFAKTMGDGFKRDAGMVNSGYPVLTWQISEGTTFTVTLTEGEGYTITGETSVLSGDDYTFTVTILDGYEADTNFAVKADGETLTANEDGTYTVPAVGADLTITVEGVKVYTETFTVTLPEGDGYTVTGEPTVEEGDDYTFTVTVEDGYNAANMTVKVNGETVEPNEDGSYTVENVSGDLAITIEGIVKIPVYTVTLPDDETITGYGAATVLEGATYTFTLTAGVGYEAGENFMVKVNGEAVKADDNGKYTIENVTCDLVITVEGMVPIVWEPVTVYFSISNDADYLVGKSSGEVMALKEITVPYFDLGLYGLDSFYFSSETYGDDGDGLPGSSLTPGTAAYAYGKITMLHLFIYATEVYYCGIDEELAGQGYLYEEGLMGTEVFTISGSAGSTFLEYIWEQDLNLNYYLNYEYPLASAGWGSTSDQILLEDGDVVTVGHFTSWSFFSDSTSVFNYFSHEGTTVTTSANQGEKVKLTLYRAGSDMSGSYTTGHSVVTSEPTAYYASVDSLSKGNVTAWTKLGTVAADGTITVDTSKLEAGEYIIAIPGQYGAEYTDDICSTPGAIRLTVSECLPGDVNTDGKVDSVDAGLIVSYYYGEVALTDEQLEVADVNGDGVVNTEDAGLIVSYFYGTIDSFT